MMTFSRFYPLFGLVVFLTASMSSLPALADKASVQKTDTPSPYTAAPSDGRKTPYLGYSWPFAGQDISQRLNDTPVLLEMFSDPACQYCPPADLFFTDLVREAPHITALFYHVNMLTVIKDNPYASEDSLQRQFFYATLWQHKRYTPEIVINGKTFVRGYMYKSVLEELQKGQAAPVAFLDIRHDAGSNKYSFPLKALKMDQVVGYNDHVSVKLIEYLKPVVDYVVPTGPNEGLDIPYYRVVSRIIPLEPWYGEERTYSFRWTPSENAAGAVIVLERAQTGLVTFGEIRLP